MHIFLGIDGGGTTTRAVLVDSEGRIRGEGQSGPANYHNVGIEATITNLLAATNQARSAAGINQETSGVFLGCAGIKSTEDISRVKLAAEAAGIGPAGDIVVANDLHNALAGGLSGKPGIALIAGTGTNCLGKDSSGRSFMCGGWGWLLDDEGGGFGLAISAMRAAARAADGRAPTTRLLESVLAFLGLSEPNEILARLYVETWTPGELAAFAPVVVRCAEEGDRVAKGILQSGSRALADLVAGAEKHLEFPKGPEVVLLGGCLEAETSYRTLVKDAIQMRCPSAQLVSAEHVPVYGAALNALRAGGISPLPKIQYS